VTGAAGASSERAAALTRLSDAFNTLADLIEMFGSAGSDRDRSTLLILVVSQAWIVRDRAAEAYEALQVDALEQERDTGETGWGVER
jgi:nucleoside phosphorylase